MNEVKYTKEEEKVVLDYLEATHDNHGRKASIISSRLRYKNNVFISPEKINEIKNNQRKREYLSREIKKVNYGDIIDTYLNCNPKDYKDPKRPAKDVVIDIMPDFPELTFGDIKRVIDDYFKILNIKKPINIKFPRNRVEEYIKKHSYEEAVDEFGYTLIQITNHLSRPKQKFEMTEEDKMNEKMNNLKNDLQSYDDGNMTLEEFKSKHTYGNVVLTPLKVHALFIKYDATKVEFGKKR